MGLPFDNQAKQSILLQRTPEEDWKVLDSSPITNLEIAMLKLQNSIPQLFTSIIRLYYHYNGLPWWIRW